MSKTNVKPIIEVKVTNTGEVFTLNSTQAQIFLRSLSAGNYFSNYRLRPLNRTGRKAIQYMYLKEPLRSLNKRVQRAERRRMRQHLKVVH